MSLALGRIDLRHTHWGHPQQPSLARQHPVSRSRAVGDGRGQIAETSPSQVQHLHEWAQYHRIDGSSPFITYRCDQCGKNNRGQEACVPRNWFKVPGEYDSSIRAGAKSFRVRGLLCEQCGDEWARRPVTLNEGLVVSPRVAERLSTRARRDTHTEHAGLLGADSDSLQILGWALLIAGILTAAYGPNLAGWILMAFGVTFLATVVLLGFSYYPRKRQRLKNLADARLVHLAEERRDTIEERQTFYGSPEWRAIRAEIIREQGRVCKSCHRHILQDDDLAVDHIRPRSVYPELSLVKDNLQVLCRTCNSSKGATDQPA